MNIPTPLPSIVIMLRVVSVSVRLQPDTVWATSGFQRKIEILQCRVNTVPFHTSTLIFKILPPKMKMAHRKVYF